MGIGEQVRHLGEVHPTPLMRIYKAENGFIVTIYQGPGLEPKEYVAESAGALGEMVTKLMSKEPRP